MNSNRKAFLISLKPGMAQEYIKRHNPVWPELELLLKKSGICNYSIFLDEESGQLFGYYETTDEERLKKLGESEVMRAWWKSMRELLVCDPLDDLKAKEIMLKEVFHLD
jgi:L-rhamnose mutarotase